MIIYRRSAGASFPFGILRKSIIIYSSPFQGMSKTTTCRMETLLGRYAPKFPFTILRYQNRNQSQNHPKTQEW